MAENPPLIEVKELHTYFHLAEGVVHAVDGVCSPVGNQEVAIRVKGQPIGQ